MVSVIIPTYNASPTVEALVSALKSQSLECEIIVVDSSSEDDTAGVAQSCGARVAVIPREQFNHGGTRNFAVRQAAGETIVFLTQDALPFDRRSIENLIKPLEDPFIAASYGRQIPRESAMPTEKFARLFNYPPTPSVKTWGDVAHLGIKAFFFSNAFSAVRRREFKELGGFPEDLIMFEDMLYAARLLEKGFSIAYTPEARVVHSHDYGFREQFRRYAMAGLSFSSNPWFLEHAGARKEGMNLLKGEIEYLLHQGKYSWCFYALVESLIKYAGYNLGLKHGRMLTLAAGKIGMSFK
jgi:rhamnosyltransferase